GDVARDEDEVVVLVRGEAGHILRLRDARTARARTLVGGVPCIGTAWAGPVVEVVGGVAAVRADAAVEGGRAVGHVRRRAHGDPGGDRRSRGEARLVAVRGAGRVAGDDAEVVLRRRRQSADRLGLGNARAAGAGAPGRGRVRIGAAR